MSASSHHSHFARHKDALRLHTFPSTKHCHLSYSAVTKTDKQEKSRMRTVLFFLFLMCNTIFCLFICSFEMLLIYQTRLPAKQEQKYTITTSSWCNRKMRGQRQRRRRREGGNNQLCLQWLTHFCHNWTQSASVSHSTFSNAYT